MKERRPIPEAKVVQSFSRNCAAYHLARFAASDSLPLERVKLRDDLEGLRLVNDSSVATSGGFLPRSLQSTVAPVPTRCERERNS